MKTLINILIIALLAFANLNAKIIYTDVKPDEVLQATPETFFDMYDLDLNQDGSDDYYINHFYGGSSYYGEVGVKKYYVTAINVDNNDVPVVLSKDADINSSCKWKDPLNVTLNLQTVWAGATDKYIGLKIKIGSNWHYGWVRISIPSDEMSVTVKDFAYQDVPDQAIKAGEKEPEVILVNSIVVTGKNGATEIKTKGGTLQMIATVKPDNAANKEIAWSVVGTCAEIDQNGLLTAKSDGDILVTADAKDGSNVKGTLNIKITGQNVKVSSITVSGKDGQSTISSKNGTLKMIATILPDDATNKLVAWSINDTILATIFDNGILQAKRDGNVTVTATSTDGSNISGSTTITITNQSTLIESIVITSISGNMEINTPTGTLQLNANILPDDATNKNLDWSVSDTLLATISNSGLLTAKDDGTVTVTATSKDGSGKSATAQVIISNQKILVSSIEVNGEGNKTEISEKGGSLQMIAIVTPENATNKTITWSVDNSAIAEINADGLLTAKGNGAVIVKAQANDNSGIFGSKEITLKNQKILVTIITIESENGENKITTPGGTLQMIATIQPANAEDKSVTWSVDDSEIARISESGLLQAKANGVVNVSATAKDGSNVSGNINITISGYSGVADDKNVKSEYSIYPNPVDDYLNLPQIDEAIIEIYTETGIKVMESIYENKLEVHSLLPGVYFLQTKDKTYKFIKN